MLATNNSAALVAGGSATETVMETRKIRLLAPVFDMNGDPREVGEEIEVPNSLAAELVGIGKAERVTDEPASAETDEQQA